jgi:hypothetical protein
MTETLLSCLDPAAVHPRKVARQNSSSALLLVMNALVRIGSVRMRNIVLTTTYPALTDNLIDSFFPHYSPLLFISRRPRHQLVATVALLRTLLQFSAEASQRVVSSDGGKVCSGRHGG